MSELQKDTLLAGRYTIGGDGSIGRGGFAFTYIAWDIRLERRVAIKEFYPSEHGKMLCWRQPGESSVVPLDLLPEEFEQRRDKFDREAKMLAGVGTIPGIVAVYDVFKENNTAYMVMELLDGTTLYSHCHENPLPIAEALHLIHRIGEPLAVVHAMGIIHRDLNPKNVMLTRDGRVVVIDFGLSRQQSHQSQSLTAAGFPGFAPPEQYQQRGSPMPSLDVYSLSALLYFMVTGKIPENASVRWDFSTGEDLLTPPKKYRQDIPDGLSEAILTGMSLAASKRPQSVRDMLQLYDVAVPTRTVASEPQSTGLKISAQFAILAREFVELATMALPQVQDGDKVSYDVLGKLAEGQFRLGDVNGARATLAIAKQAADSITNSYDKSSALRRIATEQAKVGDINGAKQTADSITNSHSKSSALKSIAEAQVNAGAINAAKQTLDAITDLSDKSSVLTAIAKAQTQTGDVQAAKQTADAITDPFRKSTALVSMAEAQAKAGDASEAKATLATAKQTTDAITSSFGKSWALESIAKAQAKAGDIDAAKQTLDAITDSDAKSSTLISIAKAQAKAGDASGAKATLATAKQTTDAITSSFGKSWALESIAKAQAKAGDFHAAKQTADAIKDSFSKSKALASIAEAQAMAGDFHAAKQTADAIKDSFSKSKALASIAEAQAMAGDVDGARATLATAQKTSDAIKRFFWNVFSQPKERTSYRTSLTLARIAGVQTYLGDVSQARATLSAAKQTADAIENLYDKSKVLAEIVVAQAKASDVDGARATVNSCDKLELRVHVCIDAANFLFEHIEKMNQHAAM